MGILRTTVDTEYHFVKTHKSQPTRRMERICGLLFIMLKKTQAILNLWQAELTDSGIGYIEKETNYGQSLEGKSPMSRLFFYFFGPLVAWFLQWFQGSGNGCYSWSYKGRARKLKILVHLLRSYDQAEAN